MKNSSKKEIQLYTLEQLALILDVPSDICYINQTSGILCKHRAADGVLVFVDDCGKRLHDKIYEYMENRGELSEKDADYLDSLFMEKYTEQFFTVDRTRLKFSDEAWLYVCIDQARAKEFNLFSGFSATHGVLTWDNSD